jgi:hypothetical protein
VLPGARLVVLVRPDRDVLGAVIGGQRRPAQRDRRRRERREPGDQLFCCGPEPARAAHDVGKGRTADHRRKDDGTLEGQARLGNPPAHLGKKGEDLRDPRRAAQERPPHVRRPEPLEIRFDAQ